MSSFILPRALREDPAQFDGLALDRRDPVYIRDYMIFLELMYRYWFRVEARGFANIPAEGPAIVVGNHNGGLLTPDTAMTAQAWFQSRGAEAPAYALIHPAIFKMPWLNVHAMKLGGVQATPQMAESVLQAGHPLLLYPGGGADAYKSYWRRNEIRLGDNTGFVRLAMRFGAPIVPVVSIGGHETLIVLTEGRRLAEVTGLAKLGIERVPVSLTFPWGLTLGAPVHVPFPVKIVIEVGRPIELKGFQHVRARSAAAVRDAQRHIVGLMQRMLDRLAEERAKDQPEPAVLPS
jgi:1-acyl-sn-glycerol-3-phosphate acyltransferase